MTTDLRNTNVKSITINIDGRKPRTINVEGEGICALFWGNLDVPNRKNGSTAVDILGTFYDSLKKKVLLSKDYCLKTFGKKRTKAIFTSDKVEVEITKDTIQILWDTPGDDGTYLEYIGKEVRCRPTGG